MRNLFAYGTLMCEDIMRKVSGYTFLPEPAILPGFKRLMVKNELYPTIIPAQGNLVEGLLYRNVPSLSWQRLDRFEGDIYARLGVLIKLKDGKSLDAETFVLKPEFSHHLDTVDWNFAEFLSKNKDEFLSRYKGFGSL